MGTIDHRQAAEERIQRLVSALKQHPPANGPDALIQECEALATAIRAFHMEGIRFRMFNVDRMLTHAQGDLGPDAAAAFSEAREHLEAAGFHTRSHQAPT